MRLIKKQIKNNKNDQTDITNILESTISELKTYLNELEQGKIYNLSQFAFGSDQYHHAAHFITRESECVLLSIKTLQATLNKIKAHHIANDTFHYDFAHYDEV